MQPADTTEQVGLEGDPLAPLPAQSSADTPSQPGLLLRGMDAVVLEPLWSHPEARFPRHFSVGVKCSGCADLILVLAFGSGQG